MNSVTNTTRLAEKQYELNKGRALNRKRNESNKEIKRNERKHKRENMVEDIDLVRVFELATSSKIFVSSLNLHEIKEFLQDYTGDFALNGLMNIVPIEHKTNIRFKIWRILKVIQTQWILIMTGKMLLLLVVFIT